jgi:very-short-patch-repair endonuclease
LCRDCQKANSKSTKIKVISKQTIKPIPTPEAKKLYDELKRIGVDIKSKNLEKWDGHKHIDLAIPKAKLNIEVDGSQHNLSPEQALRDLKRTYYSFKKGYLTLRIPNSLVRDDEKIKETAKYIKKFINENTKQMEEEEGWDFNFDF